MKKITKKAIQEFVKRAYDLYDNFYINNDHKELGDAINMMLKISDLWHDLTADLEDCLHDGNRIICEAIGETVMYWDTDVVDQLTFIDSLEDLAAAYYMRTKN